MTAPYGYPPQPTFPPQQPAYPQPPAVYPPAQPQYAPQYPAQPGYPPAQFAPPAAPLAQGSIDDFYSQPSTGGGKSLAFEQVGVRHVGIVTRPITAGDVQQQTDTQGRPQTFRDGRPKFVMKVPLQMQPSAQYPDGLATWFVKGQARDELVRAMAEAGAPAGPPESGSIIDITHTGTRPAGPGMNPAKLFQIRYQRPNGTPAPPDAQQQQQPAQPTSQPAYQQQMPSPQQQPAYPQPQPTAGAQPAYQPVPSQQPAPQQFQAQPAGPQMPADLSPEQQQLLARLSGQQ